MCSHTQEQLDEIWGSINNGKYGRDIRWNVDKVVK